MRTRVQEEVQSKLDFSHILVFPKEKKLNIFYLIY